MRERGIYTDLAFGDKSLKGAMKSADKSGAKYSIVLGVDEIASGTVLLKEMKSGESTSVTLSALASELIDRISGYGEDF